MGLFGFDEGDDAVFFGVDGEISGHVSAFASELCAPGLADDNFASFDFLTAKAFYAEALTSVIVDVFCGTACFDMGHFRISLILLYLGRRLDPLGDREGRKRPSF